MAMIDRLTRKKRPRIPAKDVPPQLIIQGNVLTFKSGLAYQPPPASAAGRCIRGFTKSARLRLIKYVATIDFKSLNNSIFITLTYPPEKETVSYRERGKHRYLFMRRLEGYLGGQVCGLWRTEWVRRKSGSTKGNIAPHFHLLLFGIPYIPWRIVREWWGKAIGHIGYVKTDIRRVRGEKGAAYYVSKYCAKPDEASLVNALQLNGIDGRHWGYHRGKLIPRHQEDVIEKPSEEQLAYTWNLLNQVWPGHPFEKGESFTLMGEYVARAHEIIRLMGIAWEGECS